MLSVWRFLHRAGQPLRGVSVETSAGQTVLTTLPQRIFAGRFVPSDFPAKIRNESNGFRHNHSALPITHHLPDATGHNRLGNKVVVMSGYAGGRRKNRR
jgi:hypothetical protein